MIESSLLGNQGASVSELKTIQYTESGETGQVKGEEETENKSQNIQEPDCQDPDILEEIEIEDFTVDGICGVY